MKECTVGISNTFPWLSSCSTMCCRRRPENSSPHNNSPKMVSEERFLSTACSTVPINSPTNIQKLVTGISFRARNPQKPRSVIIYEAD